ncbi:oxidation resistance protein 1-like [Latimeria chalumnae]|uniref:oxidation resistance protein 1-like n=1 Tax=Latimeria chalumnae TaxID=7897 RepID=UPI0003C162FA|nr:PREDICTED: oxidation resistance protein 1-like [Latimeria chalumnae]|eukprot:XP_005986835.1 PREDICTED: oxidation resistance protein 1-like [Latimeria chalumnae]
MSALGSIASYLPPRVTGCSWNLAYSVSRHGTSLKALYRAMVDLSCLVLLVIKDTDEQVFGALSSVPLKVSNCFYGTGETFLFSFHPELKIYNWTGDNHYFLKGDVDSLIIGGGRGQFGLWLDGKLNCGQSRGCETFNNDPLSKKEDFFVKEIEVWAFE